MSKNDIIRENNKKLFESRLQMKPNSSLKMNQLNIRTNKKEFKNKTNLHIFNTDIFSNDISHRKRKNQIGFEHSLNNFIKKNISVEKKKKKINNKRNKINLVNINNCSNLKIKDISFYHTKISTTKNDFQKIINVNKKGTSYKNSNNKIPQNISNKRRNEMLNINSKRQKKILSGKFSLSYLNFTYDNNNKRMSKNNKQKNSESKVIQFNKDNKSNPKRNSSSNNKDKNIYNSFLVQKIKIIKKKKIPHLNNVNSKLNKNKKTIEGKLRNTAGKSIKDSFYQNTNDKFTRITYRNLFIRKGINKTNKNSSININYSTNANNNSLLNNRKKITERNLKMNNINKLFLNKKKENPKNINLNKKKNKLKNKKEESKTLSKNPQKHNQTAKEMNSILYNKNININKYIDKKEEILDDFNIKSTKTNDDLFTEEKGEKIEETSIEEESGILSMNEIEDIIIYNNMKNINKQDNYLFKKNDYDIFLSEKQQKICSLFFGKNNNNNNQENKILKVNSEKKVNETNKEIKNLNNRLKTTNNNKEFKVLSYNNSMKRKKNVFFQK